MFLILATDYFKRVKKRIVDVQLFLGSQYACLEDTSGRKVKRTRMSLLKQPEFSFLITGNVDRRIRLAKECYQPESILVFFL